MGRVGRTNRTGQTGLTVAQPGTSLLFHAHPYYSRLLLVPSHSPLRGQRLSCPDFKLSLFLIAPPRPRPLLQSTNYTNFHELLPPHCPLLRTTNFAPDYNFGAEKLREFETRHLMFEVGSCARRSFSEGWFNALPAIALAKAGSKFRFPPPPCFSLLIPTLVHSLLTTPHSL